MVHISVSMQMPTGTVVQQYSSALFVDDTLYDAPVYYHSATHTRCHSESCCCVFYCSMMALYSMSHLMYQSLYVMQQQCGYQKL